MIAAAVNIALEQLKWLFGIKDFTEKTDIVSTMHSVINSAHHGRAQQTIMNRFTVYKNDAFDAAIVGMLADPKVAGNYRLERDNMFTVSLATTNSSKRYS
ncbi:high affinity sulfate transporter [Artemisia annua]|uniref:High affinity sulfate transporter n=1 Tax=Artemisia annua TaxID=35608 RepID=A0A2U1LBP9_ARTAN|nr:high affinity sulfate transporter [Artemisia annua]